MQSKRAVVFGGSGFLGSHMVDLLLENGWKVLNIDSWNRNIDSDSYHQENLSVSIDTLAVLIDLLVGFCPDIIFNFIAAADIQICENDPVTSVFNNVVTNTLITDSVDYIDNRCLYVFASSVYAGSDDCGFYGLSKKSCEDFIKHYFSLNPYNNYLILRYGTVYGPRATKENSIRKLIESALNTKTISHYGTGEESREYIHVRDCARNTLKLCLDPFYWNRTIKITGNNSVKSKQLVTLIKEILGNKYKIEFRNEYAIDHYLNTPYRHIKDEILNYSNDTFVDFGIGLLEVIKELDNDK